MTRLVFILMVLKVGLISTFGQMDSLSTNKFYSTLRIGLGIEKSPFIEVGFSKLAIFDKGLSSGSVCFYASGQINKTNTDNNPDYNYGGKIGIETTWVLLMSGAEIKYLTNGNDSQFYFTPRLGLSLFGFASVLYGFNLPTKNNNLDSIGRHQFSLTVNLSKKLIRNFK